MVLLFLTSSLHDMLIYHEAGNWKRSKNLSKSTYFMTVIFILDHFSCLPWLIHDKDCYSNLWALKPPFKRGCKVIPPWPSRPIGPQNFLDLMTVHANFITKGSYLTTENLSKKTKKSGWIHSRMQQNTRKSDTISTGTQLLIYHRYHQLERTVWY